MKVAFWVLGLASLFVLIEMGGFFFWDTFAGAAALLTLLFMLSFFGLFAFLYVAVTFNALANPWVTDIRSRTGPVTSSLYWAWLFEKDRLQWAKETALLVAFFTPIIAASVFAGLNIDHPSIGNAGNGFLVSCAFLAVFTFACVRVFFKHIWEEQEDEDVPLSVEQEWENKDL